MTWMMQWMHFKCSSALLILRSWSISSWFIGRVSACLFFECSEVIVRLSFIFTFFIIGFIAFPAVIWYDEESLRNDFNLPYKMEEEERLRKKIRHGYTRQVLRSDSFTFPRIAVLLIILQNLVLSCVCGMYKCIISCLLCGSSFQLIALTLTIYYSVYSHSNEYYMGYPVPLLWSFITHSFF